MGRATDRFRKELESAGVRDANLTSEIDYSRFHAFDSVEYCIYVDGDFRGGIDNLNHAVNIRSTLNQYMPGHDVQIVALPVVNNEWKSHKFEHWFFITKENDQLHIYRKFIAPAFELERVMMLLKLKGDIVLMAPLRIVVDHGNSTRQFGGEA